MSFIGYRSSPTTSSSGVPSLLSGHLVVQPKRWYIPKFDNRPLLVVSNDDADAVHPVRHGGHRRVPRRTAPRGTSINLIVHPCKNGQRMNVSGELVAYCTGSGDDDIYDASRLAMHRRTDSPGGRWTRRTEVKVNIIESRIQQLKTRTHVGDSLPNDSHVELTVHMEPGTQQTWKTTMEHRHDVWTRDTAVNE
ncbi:hypothetical protein BKA93DRAFT_751812 [Sparassis latifolia]